MTMLVNGLLFTLERIKIKAMCLACDHKGHCQYNKISISAHLSWQKEQVSETVMI